MDENLTNGKYRVDRLNGDGKLAVVKIYQTIPTAASTDQPDGKADIDVVRVIKDLYIYIYIYPIFSRFKFITFVYWPRTFANTPRFMQNEK